jgi:hypothetical protein
MHGPNLRVFFLILLAALFSGVHSKAQSRRRSTQARKPLLVEVVGQPSLRSLRRYQPIMLGIEVDRPIREPSLQGLDPCRPIRSGRERFINRCAEHDHR